ncbi:MAG TPA: cyclase family protein [Oculatellaceae cyanobacterium]
MKKRIVDLTYPIHEGMTTFPTHWHPFVEISILGRHGLENRETRKLVLGTHTGTHCDAPRHFIPGGATIDQISLEVLIGPAVVVDFTYAKAGQELGVDDFERQLGGKTFSRVVMNFGWSQHWGNMKFYKEHPFISQDSARWLVQKGVVLLGMDTPMPDDPRNGYGCPDDSPNHKILLGNDVILVEYMTNLHALGSEEIELVVMPLKIVDGDGAPARCVGIVG